MKVNLIYGAPCSGKTTYVRDHISYGEAVYDFDALYSAMSFEEEHKVVTNNVRWATLELRQGVVDACIKKGVETLWMLCRWPSEKIIQTLSGCEVEEHLVEASKDECYERLDNDDNRPDKDAWRELIDKWFQEHSESLEERGSKMNENIKDRERRMLRTTVSEFTTREQENELCIEGYFSVFNSPYEMWPGATETFAPGAFRNTLGGDIRALTNHNTEKVLGRNKSGTLELREDSHGLWGKVLINPNDQDAMNLYARVKRGDVNQCSIGFIILTEETEFSGENVHWTITEVELHEVSICTFPAYKETEVSARHEDFERAKEKQLEAWKHQAKNKLKEA